MLKWRGSLALIYVLYGPDDFSSRQALIEIKQGLGDGENLPHNTTELEGARLTAGELRAAAEAFPFFGDRRLVIVRGLLARFDTSRKAPPAKSARSAETKAELAAELAAIMNGAPPSTVLVLMDGELESKDPAKTNPLVKELKGAEVRAFPLLKGPALEKWIRLRTQSGGSQISAEAVTLLAASVGGDLWVMAGEIDKLIAYADGRQIEKSDIERMVPASQEAGIFELVDSVMSGQRTRANQLLTRLLADGQSPIYLLFMITRQLRQLVRYKAMQLEGYTPDVMLARMGVLDFIYRKIAGQAGRYSLEQLKAFYRRLLEADIAIKSGGCDEDLALTLLVADLCGP
jgi:DNA polymerase-3 subunit delta